MSEKVVVKVQRPLSGPGPWLVYDRGRARRQLLDPPPPEVVAAVGQAPKGYFDAIWTGERFVFGAMVPPQSW